MKALAAATAVVALGSCGGKADEWSLPNGDLASTRAVSGPIEAGNVKQLRVRWRYRIHTRPTFSGAMTANPVVAHGAVYLQDMRSNVVALDLETGATRWTRRFAAESPGPNGVAVDGNRLYGATDTTAFALDAGTGRVLWRRRLERPTEQFIDIAPVAANGNVYLSTIGYPPAGNGALYALDARDGSVRWRFRTVVAGWARPNVAGGGGAWLPLSVDQDGRVYAGISNPGPWGGTRKFPNGAAYGGPARWTSSLVVLDGKTGRLLWADQVNPADVRDYDFQVSPVLAGGFVVGAGKAGRVLAWNRESHRRVWDARVGLHRNDRGPLPGRLITVCPGLLGGVLTQLAVADKRVFVPVVDLCARGSATGYRPLTSLRPERARGRLTALDLETGARLWERRLPNPVFACATVTGDAVLTATYDGTLYAFRARDGAEVWRTRLRARVNACPAVSGRFLLVAAGARRGTLEVTAFALP